MTITVFHETGETGVAFGAQTLDYGDTYEFTLGEHYVIPYNLDLFCDIETSPAFDCDGDTIDYSHFVATIEPPTGGGGGGGGLDVDPIDPVFTFADGGTIVIKDEWPDVTWDIPGLTLRFPARTQLIAEGSLVMEGVTLTEAVEGEGWYGVRYEPDGGGVIRGTTIENFGFTPPPGAALRPQVCGLTVNDRWLAVYRSFIQDGINGAHGVCSYGDEAQVALWDENGDETIVRRNNGHGLYAYSQGRIFLRNGRVEDNHGNGGLALGTQARIYANETSSISDNLGVGLVAWSDGNIYLYDPNNPTDTTRTTLDGNSGGGLLAQYQGSYINAGKWLGGGGAQGTCQAACQNFILNHNVPPSPFDVKAASGSFVTAEYDHWGFGRDQESDLVLIEDATSNIDVLPIWDGVSSLQEGPVARQSGPEPSAFGSTVRGFIGEAFDKAAEGRWVPAFAKAQAALALALSEDDLQLAMGAISALVSQPDASDMPPGLLTAIEAHLGAGRETRPFALRTLLAAHRAHGREAEGRAMAQTLIADYPRTEHALTALAQEASFALEADDLAAAQTALATMEADFPEEMLTEAARAYFVLLAGEEALPARVPTTPLVASTDVTNDTALGETAGFVLHPAYPNPFNPQTVVPFSVAEAAMVAIRVFDLLGREMMTLTNDHYDAGLYRVAFDGSRLPSGMYAVRANVTPENGGSASSFTQRITLLK